MILLVFMAGLCFPVVSWSQISPGELSAAHAQLEGMENCTRCHTLGRNIGNDNCLGCHTELRARMAARTGYHATLAGRQCVECHKEHHGRDFSLLHFDPRKFDHTLAGFKLEGKHLPVTCEKCHSRTNIRAKDVLANRAMLDAHTYLGLSQKCLACHEDTHRGQLSPECLRCHTLEGWKPASRYDHRMAKFALTGKHREVECSKCHPRSLEGGRIVKFVGMNFTACTGCHVDPHRGKFQKSCESCHATTGWQDGAARNFNHTNTQFPLRGKHTSVRCEQCHSPLHPDGGTGFHLSRFQHCSDCHHDPHGGQFASRPDHGACESCHSETGWKEGVLKGFDHAKTRFPLRGKHAQVPCARCHDPGQGNSVTRVDIRKFIKCWDCHTDPHAGQFAGRPDGGACESCHGEDGFSPSKFATADHALSRFPLKGAHAATPCVKCHQNATPGGKSIRTFRWKEAATCVQCHNDPHNGQFAKWMDNGCETCHTARAWNEVSFAHERTRFPLTGKHQSAACGRCHRVTQQSAMTPVWKYAGVSSRCVDCHGDNRR